MAIKTAKEKQRTFSIYKKEPINELLKGCPSGQQSKLINDTVEKYLLLIEKQELEIDEATLSYLKSCFKKIGNFDIKLIPYLDNELMSIIRNDDREDAVTERAKTFLWSPSVIKNFALYELLIK